mgnify:CR=1 FL=1
MKRKPSAGRLAKGLERMAHEAERKAASLRELGLDRWANGVAAAARELSAAAEKAAQHASQ